MRLNHFVFAAAVALVAVSSATGSHHVKLSTAAALDATQPLQDTNEHSRKRLLRFKEVDDDSDDLDSTNEERTVNVGTLTKQLSKLESFKGLRNVDDLLKSAQSPKVTKLEQELLTKIDDNPLAKQFASQFLKDDWDTPILKNKLGITATTPATSKEYQAYKLLLQLRDYDDVVKTPDIGQKLLVKVTDDDLAKQFFGRFVDEQWTPQTLKEMMGITKNTAAGSAELNAYSALLQSRMYFDTLLKSTTPSMSKLGQNILTKVDKSPLAQKYFGQYMDDSLTQSALMTKLGITRKTSTLTDEFQAFSALVQARAFNKRFSPTPTLPEKLLGAVQNNKLAESLYKQYANEKWTLGTLKKELRFVENTAATSNQYEAFEALVLNRLYTETVANAKTTARKQGQDLFTKLEKDLTAQKYFGKFVSDGLTRDGLKTKLGITKDTPMNSKAYETFFLLTRARAVTNGLDRIKYPRNVVHT